MMSSNYKHPYPILAPMNVQTPSIVIVGPEAGLIGNHAHLIRRGYTALPCDGRTYNPAFYRELGAAIGDSFGCNEAAGLPKLPDLRGKPLGETATCRAEDLSA